MSAVSAPPARDVEVVFYAPDAPGINVVIADPDATPNAHSLWSAWKGTVAFDANGVLRTRDPEVIAAVRRGVAKGRYHEANLPEEAAPRCDQCGLTIRNQRAYGRHVRRHFDRD